MTKRITSKTCPCCGEEFEYRYHGQRYCSAVCSWFFRVEIVKFCWEWVGSKHNFGYGDFRFNKRYYRAHVFSYDLHHGDRELGDHILHKCDNPSCVNPAHLFKGTQISNMEDMATKLRSGRRKLTPDNVREIRELTLKGKTNKEIGLLYGVAGASISYISTGKNWKHIK